jgi:hypothetical protein
MEKTENVFNSWFNNTSKVMDDWKNMAGQWSSDQGNMWQGVGTMQQQWMDGYQAMLNNMTSPMFGDATSMFGNKTTQEAFFNMLKSTDVYTRLFQMWQPLFNQMQNPSFNPQDMWKFIDPSQFKSFVDKLFGFDQHSIVKNFMEQYGQFSQFFNTMSNMGPQNANTWYGNAFSTSSTSSSKIWTDLEKWGKYITKVNEMQALLYKTSISAWEKVVAAVAEKSKSGENARNFEDFYNMWSTINEQEHVALFNTEEYAKLQAELLELQIEMSKAYEEQMESMLQPYPIVLRSQLEQVHKTNHELRSRINELERIVTELQERINTKPE